MLNLSGIKKIYNRGDVTRMCLFDGFNLSVKDGEFVSIVGSNGSGKTSLLNIICGDIPVEEGEIQIDGEVVNKLPSFRRYKKIGRVYQNPAMGTCSQLTILENMALADNKGKPYGLSFAINRSRTEFYRDSLRILGASGRRSRSSWRRSRRSTSSFWTNTPQRSTPRRRTSSWS